MRFRLTYRLTDTGKGARLPDVPEDFVATEGPYPFVAEAANQANNKQDRRGRRHYTFAPEPIDSKESK